VAVTSRPKLKKTSINLGNIGGRGGSGVSTPNQFASIGQTASNNIQQIDDTIELEGRVSELEVRVTNIAATTRVLGAQNREFQTTLASIQQRVGALESGQKAILEFQKDKDKIEKRQRKLEEQRLKREGAEKGLEDGQDKKDIEDKDPKTKKAATGAMGILDRLKRFFTFVVAGWFTDKTFKLIEAFQTGNKEMINKIGLKLLAGTAAVAGIFSMAIFGIGPVLLGIGKLIAVLAGLLFNPVTLTALLIAVGVGGAILGIKKLWDWGRNKATGGQKFTDKHKELDKKLKDAGMTRKGYIKDGLKKHTNRTPEQQKIWEEVEAERERLNDLRDKMNAEIKQVVEDVPMSGSKKINLRGARTGTKKWHTKEDKEIIKQKQDAIRAKYEGMIDGGGTVGNGDNVGNGSNASADNVSSNLGPVESGEGNISVIPKYTEQLDNIQKGTQEGIAHIDSSDKDNIYALNTQIENNMLMG